MVRSEIIYLTNKSTYESDPDLECDVAEQFVQTENFDKRSTELDTDRHVRATYWTQLPIVAVNQSPVKLLRRTSVTGHVTDLQHTSPHHDKETYGGGCTVGPGRGGTPQKFVL